MLLKNKAILLMGLLQINGEIESGSEEKENSIKHYNITIDNIPEKFITDYKMKNKFSKHLNEEENILLLWLIQYLLLYSIPSLNVKGEYQKIQTNNDYDRVQYLLKKTQEILLLEKYPNERELQAAYKIYNMKNKLSLKFKVKKITVKTPEQKAQMMQFLQYQQSTDCNGEQHRKNIDHFMHQYKDEKESKSYSFHGLYYVSEYVGHVKIPSEFEEAQRFLMKYGYFIYGKDVLVSSDETVYYILYTIEEGTDISLQEFITLESRLLLKVFILNLLKKKTHYIVDEIDWSADINPDNTDRTKEVIITINGTHVMNILDKVLSKILFKK